MLHYWMDWTAILKKKRRKKKKMKKKKRRRPTTTVDLLYDESHATFMLLLVQVCSCTLYYLGEWLI